MSISKRKLAANRANGQKSHGPVTPEGKAKVSQNARKHGLCGRFEVLEGEDQDAFDYVYEQFVKDEQPIGSVELELVRRMAEYSWLRDRAARFQTACFRVEPPIPELVEQRKTRVAFSPELERFLNYQAHFDRQFSRASAELLKRKKERRLLAAGFVSQKRMQAAELRAEKQQEQRNEKHYLMTDDKKLAIQIKQVKLEAALSSKNLRQAA